MLPEPPKHGGWTPRMRPHAHTPRTTGPPLTLHRRPRLRHTPAPAPHALATAALASAPFAPTRLPD
jgi:hypothetical protein